jgi:cell division septal protein FtsQ
VIDERIAERRAEVRDDRRRTRLHRTRVLVLVAILVAGLVAVERSALVGLEEVRVRGTERLDEAAVLAAADLDLGTSTLRLGLGEAAERVTALPLVRETRASRVDPLTVQIEVVEREPVLNVVGGDRTRLVDRDGVVIADGALAGLPEIRLDHEPPEVGRGVGEDPALANAHLAWRGLSGPLRTEVARFDAEGPEELTLQLERGIDVRFGRAQRLDEKVRALGAILADLESEITEAAEVAIIDVRAPAAPVIVGR